MTTNLLKPRSLAWTLFLLPGLSACGLIEPEYCTTGVARSIIVETRDAATGAPAASGVVGRAEDGAFSFELVVAETGADALHLYGPSERAGTYQVTLAKEGYEPWTQEGVRVTPDECHVRTVHLRADLQPV